MTSDLPRNEELPLFNPHRVDFTCQVEAGKVPPIDAEADAWFLEARALETDPELLENERDWKRIVRLTRQAAERRHWKAMLNLASLYLDGRDPERGVEDAVVLVEQGMRLGVPAAYDRMGTYHMNGAVQGDVSQAYAFWQKAAEMGNPQAMTFLAEKLMATWDNPKEGFWANIPVGTKMLECAFGQGDAQAALALQYQYSDSGTSGGKNRAMRVLHEGVKLGCAKCAHYLQLEFDDPEPTKTIVPHRDKVRSERYQMLGDALDFNPSRRFPNLDKMLPLPPARLPPWDGKRESLMKAVMAVTPPKAVPEPSAASQSQGREFLDAAYDLHPTEDRTSDQYAPFAAYWRPTAPREALPVRAYLGAIAPALYRPGEAFVAPRYPDGAGRGAIPGIVWERLITVHHNHGAVEPRAPAGLMREVAAPEPRRSGTASQACPATGSWQPWLPMAHPLRHAVNQPWRQAWVTAGQRFPDPRTDWLLPLDAGELTWHLLHFAKPDHAQEKGRQ
ncbi:tetratricopeptide repeat protein [Massilia jejuensis]|uniref:Tetratricopeptide repeat protein n=1 Tax=Massilia jejuensis TaxID=648894 RepID=A0ABW0PN93_9BURK